jgi:hypothetical protein
MGSRSSHLGANAADSFKIINGNEAALAYCFLVDFHTRRDVAPGGLRQGGAFDVAALGDG